MISFTIIFQNPDPSCSFLKRERARPKRGWRIERRGTYMRKVQLCLLHLRVPPSFLCFAWKFCSNNQTLKGWISRLSVGNQGGTWRKTFFIDLSFTRTFQALIRMLGKESKPGPVEGVFLGIFINYRKVEIFIFYWIQKYN